MTEIVDYEVYEMPPRWLFLRLETSDGTVGWGEPIATGTRSVNRSAPVSVHVDSIAGDQTDEGHRYVSAIT